MKKYVVAFISFFDNELLMDHLMAEDKVDAMIQYLGKNGYQYEGEYTESAVMEYAFDCDALVNAYCVS